MARIKRTRRVSDFTFRARAAPSGRRPVTRSQTAKNADVRQAVEAGWNAGAPRSPTRTARRKRAIRQVVGETAAPVPEANLVVSEGAPGVALPSIEVGVPEANTVSEGAAHVSPDVAVPSVEVEMTEANAVSEGAAHITPDVAVPSIEIETTHAVAVSEGTAHVTPDVALPSIDVEMTEADAVSEEATDVTPDVALPSIEVEDPEANTVSEGAAHLSPDVALPSIEIETTEANAVSEGTAHVTPDVATPPIEVEVPLVLVETTTSATPDTDTDMSNSDLVRATAPEPSLEHEAEPAKPEPVGVSLGIDSEETGYASLFGSPVMRPVFGPSPETEHGDLLSPLTFPVSPPTPEPAGNPFLRPPVTLGPGVAGSVHIPPLGTPAPVPPNPFKAQSMPSPSVDSERAPYERAPSERAPSERAPSEKASPERDLTQRAPSEKVPSEDGPSERAPSETAPFLSEKTASRDDFPPHVDNHGDMDATATAPFGNAPVPVADTAEDEGERHLRGLLEIMRRGEEQDKPIKLADHDSDEKNVYGVYDDVSGSSQEGQESDDEGHDEEDFTMGDNEDNHAVMPHDFEDDFGYEEY